MAQAQGQNPQIQATCVAMAAQMYPLGIQAMLNVQAVHEEIAKLPAPWGTSTTVSYRMTLAIQARTRGLKSSAGWQYCL